MGRADLIGAQPRHLVPRDQPVILERETQARPAARAQAGGKADSPVGARRATARPACCGAVRRGTGK
jgi:hypothetical protein